MPTASVTGTIITRKFDDDSEDVIEIRTGRFEDTGNYVRVKNEASSEDFYFNPDSWQLVRDEIDKLFAQMEPEQ